MPRISLKSAIDESFIKSFQGVAQQRNGGNNFAAALQGGSSQVGISTGLRLGAQAFAGSVGGLNSLIGFVSLADRTLEGLGDLTDEMITLAERAGETGVDAQERRRLSSKFRKLVSEFRETIDQAEFSGRELLDLPDLKAIFNTLGFDETSSSSVAAVFEEFHLFNEDPALASEEAKGDRPIPIPPEAFKIRTPSGTKILSKVTREYDSIFSSERNLEKKPDAFRIAHDLKALREQIDNNRDALATTSEFIGDNLEMVRAAGFAFLDLSQTIPDGTEASIVAKELRKKIRKAPAQALNQLENLEPLVVAALSLDSDSTGQ